MTEVLSEEEKKALHKEKMSLRMDNERYLRSHPEIRDMVASLVESLVLEKPKTEAILPFIRDHFETYAERTTPNAN